MNESIPASLKYVYDNACRHIREILSVIIQTKNSENHLNSIISMNMGTDFESPKHLY